jgi:uncharacterized membrane protein YgcG
MKRSQTRAGALIALVGALFAQTGKPGPSDPTSKALAATLAFTSTLTDEQRPKAIYTYDSDRKPKWNNLPPNMANPAGIPLSELNPTQRDLALAVVQSVLSPYGYQKTLNVMDADAYFGTNMGAAFPTGRDAYRLAIFGKPSLTEPWEIQFNGHHLGLNVTIVGKNNVMAPSMIGAYPNIYPKDGKEFHVMGEETSRAISLMQALSADQQKKATITSVMGDYILGPGHDGEVVQPEGLKASEMTAQQKKILLDLTSRWVNVINDSAAKIKMAEVQKNIDATWFAWSGKPDAGEKAYFRVQGPTVWIEYAPQNSGFGAGGGRGGGRGGSGGRGGGRGGSGGGQGFGGQPQAQGPGGGDRGGAPRVGLGGQPNVTGQITAERDPNHVHTVYRDFTNDYGKRLAAR